MKYIIASEPSKCRKSPKNVGQPSPICEGEKRCGHGWGRGWGWTPSVEMHTHRDSGWGWKVESDRKRDEPLAHDSPRLESLATPVPFLSHNSLSPFTTPRIRLNRKSKNEGICSCFIQELRKKESLNVWGYFTLTPLQAPFFPWHLRYEFFSNSVSGVCNGYWLSMWAVNLMCGMNMPWNGNKSGHILVRSKWWNVDSYINK